MDLNLNQCYAQADELRAYTERLYSARTALYEYINAVRNNWQGREVEYFARSADETANEITIAITQIEQLSRTIKSTGAQIHKEEVAAARARALREQKIRNAQNDLNRAQQELDSLRSERARLENEYRGAGRARKAALRKNMLELDEKIRNAETALANCRNALSAAQR